MPQVFQVLRCYKCLVFQVHQTKKSNKWQCKLCGEKQSVKRHYGIGSGKDCRLHVQKLNKMRGDNEEIIESVVESNDEDLLCEDNILESKPLKRITGNSKWNAYVDQSINVEPNNESDLDDDPMVSYKRKDNKRKYNKVKMEEGTENEQSIYTINDSIHINVANSFRDNISEYTPSPVTKPNRSTNILNETGNTFNHSISSNNNLTMKNSKWLNYIDQNEELSNSNETIYLPDKDNIFDTSFKKINAFKTTPLLNRKIKSIQQNFEENINESEYIDDLPEATDIKTTQLPEYINFTENKTSENPSTMFTLCDDIDLDSILNI